MNVSIGNLVFPEAIEKEFSFIKLVNVEKDRIFQVITNVENHPKVLPDNIISVKIINQTENTTFVYEEVKEAGISSTLFAKHTIIPHESYTIEILDGDAYGTIINIKFEEKGSSTKLDMNLKMRLKGFLIPFGFLPDHNLQSAADTVITEFVNFAKINKNQ